MRKKDFYCHYPNCKNIAEYQTGLNDGTYCHIHFKILKEKFEKKGKKLTYFKINYSPNEKKVLKKINLMKNVDFFKKLKSFWDLKQLNKGRYKNARQKNKLQ
jgi:hypothetical protein